MAAHEIAEAGFKVLILEKHHRPGRPLCCAEAVTRQPLHDLLEPLESWIKSRINRVKVFGPWGYSFEVYHPEAGYILDRTVFDYDLASRAVEAGCRLECETIGLRLECGERLFSKLEILKPGGVKNMVEAPIFIAADGVESGIARRAGIDNDIDPTEVESLLQYRLEDISLDPETMEFHMGHDIAPGGYLWVFPRSSSAANVGLGITIKGQRSIRLENLLNGFIESRFKHSKIVEKHCGLVPKYQGRKAFRRGNLLVVGDAARALDSLTGAGIINAMKSGRYAGRAAVEYLSGRITGIDDIEELYPGRFFEEKEKELDLYLKLRQMYLRLTDDEIKDIIEVLDNYFGGKTVRSVNAFKLLAHLTRTRPRLLRLVRHLI